MLKHRISKLALIGLATFALAGCASHYDRKTGNTMMGAGLGAAAGAVVSQGDPLFTLGGAAAGGVLGNILTEDDRRRSRNWDNNGRSRHHANDRNDRRRNDRDRRHRR